MGSQKGFTLVEIIIVIAVIAALASLAIPALLRSRLQANEAAALANLRVLSWSAESFRTTQNPPLYPVDLVTLISAIPPYLDSAWANNQRQGYAFSYVRSEDGFIYTCVASPWNQNITGINSFCVDQTGVLRRYAPGAAMAGNAGCDSDGALI